MSDGGGIKGTRAQTSVQPQTLAKKRPDVPEHIDGLKAALGAFDIYGTRWSKTEPAGVQTAAHYAVATGELIRKYEARNLPSGYTAHVLEEGTVVFQRKIHGQLSFLGPVKMVSPTGSSAGR